MDESLNLIQNELRRANTLMHQNRNTIALHPEMYRHHLNQIQAALNTLYERIPQNGAQRVRVRAERHMPNDASPVLYARHPDAFAGLRQHLAVNDLGAIRVREGDVPLRRATHMPPSENLMDIEEDRRPNKRPRERFGRRYPNKVKDRGH